MEKTKNIEVKSITLNNGTFVLPKPIHITQDFWDMHKTEQAVIVAEILRLECEALSGESVPWIYESEPEVEN